LHSIFILNVSNDLLLGWLADTILSTLSNEHSPSPRAQAPP